MQEGFNQSGSGFVRKPFEIPERPVVHCALGCRMVERYPRGPRGLTRNQLGVARRAWVRIPPSPPVNQKILKRTPSETESFWRICFFKNEKAPCGAFSGSGPFTIQTVALVSLLHAIQRFGAGHTRCPRSTPNGLQLWAAVSPYSREPHLSRRCRVIGYPDSA